MLAFLVSGKLAAMLNLRRAGRSPSPDDMIQVRRVFIHSFAITRNNTMTKKLLTTDGKRNATIDPKKIYRTEVKFDPPSVIRVCNASSKEPYKTPQWPSARASKADEIASVGVPC